VYLTEKGAPMWKDILHARIPKGPSGQYAKAIQGMPAEDAVKWAHDDVAKA
jgi:hypothetical protein